MDRLQNEAGHLPLHAAAVSVLRNYVEMRDFFDAYVEFRNRSIATPPDELKAGILLMANSESEKTLLRWSRMFKVLELSKSQEASGVLKLFDASEGVHLIFIAMAELEKRSDVKDFFRAYVEWTRENVDTERARSNPEAEVRAQIQTLLPIFDQDTRARWNSAVVDLYHSALKSEDFAEASRS